MNVAFTMIGLFVSAVGVAVAAAARPASSRPATSASVPPRFNLVADGGFESPRLTDWNLNWDSRLRLDRPGCASAQCLRVSFETSSWSCAEQVVALPRGAAKVRASCQVRLRDVVVLLPPDALAREKAERARRREEWRRKEQQQEDEARRTGKAAKSIAPPKEKPDSQTRGGRMFVLFLDADKKQLGKWQGLHFGSGTRAWRRLDKAYDVPAGARFVRVMVGLEYARGTAWFDDVCLEALDAHGRPLARVKAGRTDTAGWFAFRPPPFRPKRHSVLDDLAAEQAPAGKHGRVVVRNGRLAFADGTPARFWGVNLVADGALPDHPTADALAVCLARYGCNMVRLAFLDAPRRWWGRNLFAPGDNTRHLDPANLDRLDYLLAQLKRRGIYVNIELLCRREFRRGDGVADYDKLYNQIGLSPALMFDPRLIALQKEFATELLTHRNPYTHTRWCDDPAVAMVSLMNENSLLHLTDRLGADSRLSPYYQRELTAMWNAWLRRRYASRGKLAAAWGAALKAGEDPARGTVALSGNIEQSGLSMLSGPRLRDATAFLYHVEQAYLRTLREHLRKLGLRAVVGGSCDAKVSSARVMDYVDDHAYWDQPHDGYAGNLGFNNAPAVTGADRFWGRMFWQRIAGRPYAVTEWNFCWPNEYRCEGPLETAALAAAQGVDCALLYRFGAAGGSAGTYDLNWPSRFSNPFALRAQPTVLCQFPVAAHLLVRGDLAPMKTLVTFPFTAEQAAKGIEFRKEKQDKQKAVPRDHPKRHGADEAKPADGKPEAKPADEEVKALSSPALAAEAERKARELPAGLYRKARVAMKIVPAKQRPPKIDADNLPADPQFRWVGRALRIDTPRTQGVVGFMGKAAVELTDLRITCRTPFAALAVTSLDAAPIADSRRLLLTADARAENTGMLYSSARTRLLHAGTGPILIEPVVANVSIRVTGSRWRLTPLDANGCERKGQGRDLTARNGRIDVSLGRDRCLWYELKAEPGN